MSAPLPPPPPSHPLPQYTRPADDRPPPPNQDKGLAVAALILALIPLLVTTIIGFIMSIVVLARGRQTAGWGMGLAALIISSLWFVVGVALIAAVGTFSSGRDASGTITEPSSVSSLSVKIGDCTAPIPESEEVDLIDAVPCAQPHRGEVYAEFTLPDGDYPGDDRVVSLADTGCADRFEDFVGLDIEESSVGIFYLYPVRSTWAQDRRVTCLAYTEEDRRGSLQGSNL